MKILIFISAFVTLLIISYYFKGKGRIFNHEEDFSTSAYNWRILKTVLAVSAAMLLVLAVLYGLVKLISELDF